MQLDHTTLLYYKDMIYLSLFNNNFLFLFLSDQSAFFGVLELLLLFSAFDSKNCCTFLLRLGWCYAASSFPVTCSYWLFLLLFFDFDRFLINDVTTEALLFTVSTKKAKSLPTKSKVQQNGLYNLTKTTTLYEYYLTKFQDLFIVTKNAWIVATQNSITVIREKYYQDDRDEKSIKK